MKKAALRAASGRQAALVLATLPAYNARMDENKLRRRWLSFGIRDLLWATAVVGLAVLLFLERGERDRVNRMTIDWQAMHRRG